MSNRGQSSTDISSISFIYQCASMTSSVSTTSHRWIFKILKLLISWIRWIPLINKVLHVFNGLKELPVFLLKISHRSEAFVCVFLHCVYVVMCETNFTLEISLHDLIVNLMHPVRAILLNKPHIACHWKREARGLSVPDKWGFWIANFVEIWICLSVGYRSFQLVREIFHDFCAILDLYHQAMVFSTNFCDFIFLLPNLSFILFDLVNQFLLHFLFIPWVITAFSDCERWFKCSQGFFLGSSLLNIWKRFVQFLCQTKLVWRSTQLLLFQCCLQRKAIILILWLRNEWMGLEVLVRFQSCLDALV